jgi:predicted ATPase/class 3 adenylate cyclase
MDFYDVLDKVQDLLMQRGRVSYRALKLQFHLDDETLEALKEELIEAHHLAVDQDGRMLVWTGEAPPTSMTPSPPSPHQATRHADRPPQPASPAAAPPAAERRQLTVMFCDLVESTVLATQLDPEDLRQVVRAYQATCAEVIQRFEGSIAQYLGDGLLVYFGYPQAHEDDAQRAVWTGLGIVEAMDTLNSQLAQRQGIRLAVRVGIHTGLVVVGEIGGSGRQEQLALGDTPNIAARLQGLAAPDTVVISAATQRLIQGYFTCDDLGAQTLKGVAIPLEVYQVVGETEVQQRFDLAAARGLTPLVGREHEVALLRERWAQVQAGRGHIVVLSGEAGIGKSRLVQVVKDEIIGTATLRIEYRCSPYHQHSALYPVITHLERVLALHWDDTPEDRLRKLEEALQPYSLPLAEVVPLLASLLSVPLSASYPPLTLTPQRQKQKTLEALLTWLLALTEQQPVLFVVEDLHWIDPSTLEFLTLLMEQGPTARLLTLLTCRPEFQVPWGLRTHLTPIALQRLPQPQVEVMVARVTGGKALPSAVLQHVVTKTDGVPLFVEELTKTVLESGLLRETEGYYELTGPLPPLAIPATLHDSLMARLDRLATVKAVAQLGAVLGRTFPYELLQAVAPLDEAVLQQALSQLIDAELLYQRGVPPQAIYLFKHALLQETAYQSLLKSTRQQYHQRIAQVLETRFPASVETQPELVAHHYTAAGLSAQALPYWQQAGQRALTRSAYIEAIAHLTRGLELLRTLPETLERTQQELTFSTTLGAPLVATKGYAAPEVEQTYARARSLCQRLGETPQLFPTLGGLVSFYVVRAELQIAQELGERCFALAQREQDPALLLQSFLMLGSILYYRGVFVPAHTHLQEGIALYAPQKHHALALLYTQDPGVGCHGFGGLSLWFLGYPNQARRRIDEALALARELSQPYSLAFALFFAVWLSQLRGEVRATQERAEALMTLSSAQGFPLWEIIGTRFRSWALAAQGQPEEGIAQVRQSLTGYRTLGAELASSYWGAVLAAMHGGLGQTAEAQIMLAEAIVGLDKTEERFYEAELYRLKGELCLQQTISDTAQAETCFQQAHAIARHQQAKSLELRAAMSLSRLWQQQGKRAEARALLAPIYGWFTEGFDTADLQDAKALLETLEEARS